MSGDGEGMIECPACHLSVRALSRCEICGSPLPAVALLAVDPAPEPSPEPRWPEPAVLGPTPEPKPELNPKPADELTRDIWSDTPGTLESGLALDIPDEITERSGPDLESADEPVDEMPEVPSDEGSFKQADSGSSLAADMATEPLAKLADIPVEPSPRPPSPLPQPLRPSPAPPILIRPLFPSPGPPPSLSPPPAPNPLRPLLPAGQGPPASAIAKRLFTDYEFKGRMTKGAFWRMFAWRAGAALVGTVLILLEEGVQYDEPGLLAILGFAGIAVVFVTGLAEACRRLHDTGKPGTWNLLLLIPYIGFIPLIFLLAQDGEPQDNAYGPPNAEL